MNSKPCRLTFDELFDLVALFFACRGTCNRLRASTVIRDSGNVLIGAGYNGALSGMPHCDDEGVGHLMVEGHCLRTDHSEENAVLNCLDLARLKDGEVTMIGSPCFPCARKLIGRGIKRLRYIGVYPNALGHDLVQDLCRKKNVRLEFVNVSEVLETLKKALEFLQGPGGPLKDWPEIELKFTKEL